MPKLDLIQMRRGTAAQWTTANSTLSSGEIGVEVDTGLFKIGDGSTYWTLLPYAAATASALAAETTRAQAAEAALATAKTRRVSLPIAVDTAGGLSGVTDLLQRHHITLPVATTRWRLKIRNFGSAGALAGALTATHLFVGTPAYGGVDSWQGACTGALTDVLSGISLPADGSEYTTAWITAAGVQFAPDVPQVLSLGVTPASGSVVLSQSATPNAVWTASSGTAVSGQAGLASPSTGSFATNGSYFDIRLEYEALTSLPVGLFVGDSTTAGYSDFPSAMVPGPGQAWPAQAAMRDRFLWINAGIGGSLATQWSSGAYKGWARVAAWSDADIGSAVAVPDFAVISLGINDAGAGESLSTFATAINSIVGIIQGIGVRRIYATTVLPQGQFKPGFLTAAAAAAATTLSTSVPYANGDSIIIDQENFTVSDTVTVSGASTGSAPPYTTHVAATTNAHGVNATTGLAASELFRVQYNWQLLGGVPPGIACVFDFAVAMCEPGTRNVPAQQLWRSTPGDTTSVHPNTRGYGVMAGTVRIPK